MPVKPAAKKAPAKKFMESAADERKELPFLRKGGASKAMLAEEAAEAKGAKMANGGMVRKKKK